MNNKSWHIEPSVYSLPNANFRLLPKVEVLWNIPRVLKAVSEGGNNFWPGGLLAPTWERYLWPFVTSEISAYYSYTPLQTGQENNTKDGRFSCRASFTFTLLSENLCLLLPGTSHNGRRRSLAAPFFKSDTADDSAPRQAGRQP